MNKRNTIAFILAFLIFSMSYIFPTKVVHAYTNPYYTSNVNVELEHMASSTLTGKTDGEYYFNGKIIPSGTLLNFKITNGKINVNGTEYSEVIFSQKVYGTETLFSLTRGSETNMYLGTLNFKVTNGKIYPVNSLPIEDYLKGVVGYEMSPSYPIEALKAQAVAARTYALRYGGKTIDDTTSYQVYYGYNPKHTRVIDAVLQTKGQVLTYDGTLVDALYSASHGGYSEASQNVWSTAFPYLISKEDIFNGQPIDDGDWGEVTWGAGPTREFKASDIDAKLKSNGYLTSTDTFIELDLQSITRYTSGRVSNVNIVYKDKDGIEKVKSITKTRARSFLSLPSSMWNVTFDEGTSTYTFTGKAYGHGVGMSQVGAKERAAAGQNYTGILAFYYDSTKLENLYITPGIGSFTAGSAEAVVGQPITLNAIGQEGTGKYKYKFVVYKDNALVSDSAYVDSSTYKYTPAEPGSYKFTVYLRDTQSIKNYDDSQSLTVTVTGYANVKIQSLTISKPKVLTGQSAVLNATAVSGSGNYLYKYEVSKNNKVIYTKDFSTNKTLTYIPKETGTYSITAYAKDSDSKNAYVAASKVTLTAYAAPKITSASASGNMYVTKPVTIKANYSGGTPSGSILKYEVYKGSSPYYKKDFSTSKSYTFTPSSAGTYTVKVYLKDSTSTKAYDGLKSFNVTIKGLPVVVTKTTLSYGMKHKDVAAVQTALKKLGYRISSATGYYGSETKKAVLSFQKAKKLKQTGIIDKTTINAINTSLIAK
jgi:SpoIID/LytB domain protein